MSDEPLPAPASTLTRITTLLQGIWKDEGMMEYVHFLRTMVTSVILPWALTILIGWGVVGTAVTAIRKVVYPPSPFEQHREAKQAYHKGNVTWAVRLWETDPAMQSYGPAILSLGCHWIYMNDLDDNKRIHDDSTKPSSVEKGIHLLTHAIGTSSPKQGSAVLPLLTPSQCQAAERMREDAKAILNGNQRMIDMNARLEKLQWLGIASL